MRLTSAKPITLREHCATIGRVKTPKKAAASRENGKKGGRPTMNPFTPVSEPARSIYTAFQAEAKKRPARSVPEWMEAELDAVYRESVHQAKKLGLTEPTFEEVKTAERLACGHVDYGSKWAYGIVDIMETKTAPQGQE